MNAHFSLPGLRRVGFVLAEEVLPAAPLYAAAELPVPVLAKITPVELCGNAALEVVSERSNGAQLQKATLKFNSLQRIPVATPLAFVVVDNNGRKFLIGSNEPPKLALKASDNAGTPDGDPAVISYEAALSAPFAAINAICPDF